MPRRRRREVPEGPDAEAVQQARQLRPVQDRQRIRREERRGPALRHDEAALPGPVGQLRREQPVRDARAAVVPGLDDGVLRVDAQRLLAAVEARRAPRGQRAQPRPHHLHARRQLRDRLGDRLEQPPLRVAVALAHHEPGHRRCASRSRCPRRTPSARAAAVQAATRPRSTTAPGVDASTPAAVAGQSGHHTARTRVTRPPPRRARARAAPQPGSPEVNGGGRGPKDGERGRPPRRDGPQGRHRPPGRGRVRAAGGRSRPA
ncbi:MAG: hypothetical protein FWJ90_03195 [Actinomadura sp.]